jgi:hypothetical protein
MALATLIGIPVYRPEDNCDWSHCRTRSTTTRQTFPRFSTWPCKGLEHCKSFEYKTRVRRFPRDGHDLWGLLCPPIPCFDQKILATTTGWWLEWQTPPESTFADNTGIELILERHVGTQRMSRYHCFCQLSFTGRSIRVGTSQLKP